MSFIDPLARGLERLVYDRICALSQFAPRDMGHATGSDALASPVDGKTSPHR